jgi:uncharacterized coiled-coil protein SlyX
MSKEISKRFVLKLSDKSILVKVTERTEAGVVETEYPLRGIEVAMLTSLFDISASSQESFKAANECLDCIGHIEALTDDECEIVLTQKDLDYLTGAFKKSAERAGRPHAWNKCRALVAQLGNPQEKKAEEKKAEESKPE